MIRKNLSIILIFLFLISSTVFADDFEDEEDFEETGTEEAGTEETEKEESFEDEESKSGDPLEEKKEEKKVESVEDLLEEEKKVEESPKEESVGELLGAPEKKLDEKAVEPKGDSKGFKPVILVKGGFYLYGKYKDSDKKEQQVRFGGVDEGIIGAQYMGRVVKAKATVNVRTGNHLLSQEVIFNPLVSENYYGEVVENPGAVKAKILPYEIFGGVSLFDMIDIKAGNLIPEYGIADRYQNLDVVVGTPFGTRSLLVVEGVLPETEGGLSIGGSYPVGPGKIAARLMVGGNDLSTNFSYSDRSFGFYGRAGYESEMITAYASFQSRSDYYVKEGGKGKDMSFFSYGVAAKFSHEIGVEALFSFDMANFHLVSDDYKLKPNSSMFLHFMPAYNFKFKHDYLEKLQVSLRIDYFKGLYKNESADRYLDATFNSDNAAMRIGAGLNLFAKELEKVRSYAGVTLMVQPAADVAKGKTNEGFLTMMLSGGAEF